MLFWGISGLVLRKSDLNQKKDKGLKRIRERDCKGNALPLVGRWKGNGLIRVPSSRVKGRVGRGKGLTQKDF